MRPYLHTIALASVGRLGPRALLGHRWFIVGATVMASRGAWRIA